MTRRIVLVLAMLAALPACCITASKEYVDKRDAATLKTSKDYTDIAVQQAGGMTPKMTTNVACYVVKEGVRTNWLCTVDTAEQMTNLTFAAAKAYTDQHGGTSDHITSTNTNSVITASGEWLTKTNATQWATNYLCTVKTAEQKADATLAAAIASAKQMDDGRLPATKYKMPGGDPAYYIVSTNVYFSGNVSHHGSVVFENLNSVQFSGYGLGYILDNLMWLTTGNRALSDFKITNAYTKAEVNAALDTRLPASKSGNVYSVTNVVVFTKNATFSDYVNVSGWDKLYNTDSQKKLPVYLDSLGWLTTNRTLSSYKITDAVKYERDMYGLMSAVTIGRRGSGSVGADSMVNGYACNASFTYSHAEGNGATASGQSSHAEGYGTTASEYYSHAEGTGTTASGLSSHAEGTATTASGSGAHAEGNIAKALGTSSHAEGHDTNASGEASHSEGYRTHAIGRFSHSEGFETEASGHNAHAEGSYTVASKDASHASGYASCATNDCAFTWKGTLNDTTRAPTAEEKYGSHGDGTYNLNPVGGLAGFWIGETNMATHIGNLSYTKAAADNKFVHLDQHNGKIYSIDNGMAFSMDARKPFVFYNTTNTQDFISSLMPDDSPVATSNMVEGIVAQHGGGGGTSDYNNLSNKPKIGTNEVSGTHTISYYGGVDTSMATNIAYRAVTNHVTSGYLCKVETATQMDNAVLAAAVKYETDSTGNKTAVTIGSRKSGSLGYASFVNGFDCLSSVGFSHAEGDQTTASGRYSHAEGYEAKAIGESSHAEGWITTASGKASHAEGIETTASYDYAHAEGKSTTASGEASHAEGFCTIASGLYAHAEGYGTTASKESSHAEGKNTKATANASHAEGYMSNATNVTAFVWQGAEDIFAPHESYYDHGKGTFNLNPVGGLSGFWIGETNMATHIGNLTYTKSAADDKFVFQGTNAQPRLEFTDSNTMSLQQTDPNGQFVKTLDWGGDGLGWQMTGLAININPAVYVQSVLDMGTNGFSFTQGIVRNQTEIESRPASTLKPDGTPVMTAGAVTNFFPIATNAYTKAEADAAFLSCSTGGVVNGIIRLSGNGLLSIGDKTNALFNTCYAKSYVQSFQDNSLYKYTWPKQSGTVALTKDIPDAYTKSEADAAFAPANVAVTVDNHTARIDALETNVGNANAMLQAALGGAQ